MNNKSQNRGSGGYKILIWIFFIAMTAAALALALRPLIRAGQDGYSGALTTHSHELEVYKDQLKELDRDRQQGMVSKAEASAARIEISRRMLASADALEELETESGKSGSRVQTVFNLRNWKSFSSAKQAGLLGSVLAVSGLTLGLYAKFGSPARSDLPFAQRFPEKATSAEAQKIAGIEEKLQKTPRDGTLWDKIGPLYLGAGKYHKAQFSFRKAGKLLGENSSRLAGFAEATTLVNKGKITPMARRAYQAALKLDPDLVEPRVRLAMGMEQSGDTSNAAKAYQDIIGRSGKNAPWLPFVKKRLSILLGKEDPGLVRARVAEEKKIADLIGKVEERLKNHPEDGKGWDVIAPVYLSQGSYKKAAAAFARAREILGDNARRIAGFAEATTMQNNGIVTPVAVKAYRQALKLKPTMIEARIRLAMALEQEENYKGAAAAFEDILKRSNKKSPWRPMLRQRLAAMTARLNGTHDRGPTAEDVKRISKMKNADRSAFINQMVSNLSERLEENGNDLGGWLKLLNAYRVLGQKDDAVKALGKARKIFRNDDAALQKLASAAKKSGL